MVDDALEPYLKFVKENLLDNAKKHAAQKMEEFAEKKNELIGLYLEHCTYFTQGFNNPELQSQAKMSLNNTINSIYLKVLNRWQVKQAATTVDTLLQQQELELTEDLIEKSSKGIAMSKEEFIELLNLRCTTTKGDIEARFYPSAADQLQALREEFRETVAFLTADCDLNEEVKAKPNAPEDESALANDQDEAKSNAPEGKETQFSTFQILNLNAACLQDDYVHGYTIFDDPKKVFAMGASVDRQSKQNELENTVQWGEMDEIQFRAKIKIFIDS